MIILKLIVIIQLISIIKDNTIYVDCETPLNGSIDVYTYDNVTKINGTYFDFDDFFTTGWLSRTANGLKNPVTIENGKASFKLDGVSYFVLDSYGHLDESVGYSSDNKTNYGKIIKITYNGKTLSRSEAYADQFDIDNSLNIFDLDGNMYGDNKIVHNGKLISNNNKTL